MPAGHRRCQSPPRRSSPATHPGGRPPTTTRTPSARTTTPSTEDPPTGATRRSPPPHTATPPANVAVDHHHCRHRQDLRPRRHPRRPGKRPATRCSAQPCPRGRRRSCGPGRGSPSIDYRPLAGPARRRPAHAGRPLRGDRRRERHGRHPHPRSSSRVTRLRPGRSWCWSVTSRSCPEIDAGGSFRALTERADARCWSRTDARSTNGSATPSTTSATATSPKPSPPTTTNGRIVTADNADALRQRLVDDWFAAT